MKKIEAKNFVVFSITPILVLVAVFIVTHVAAFLAKIN